MPTARDEDEMTEPGPGSSEKDDFVKTLVVQQGGEFGFDFDAFERSEAEAEAATRAPRHLEATVPLQPERRTIVPRNWLSPGDSVVESRPVGNMTVVTLRGRINETFRGAELGQSLTGV